MGAFRPVFASDFNLHLSPLQTCCKGPQKTGFSTSGSAAGANLEQWQHKHGRLQAAMLVLPKMNPEVCAVQTCSNVYLFACKIME
jgi:hypothetical protein